MADELKVTEIRIDKKFASRLPPTTAGEREALRASIAEHGVIVPLVVTRDGLLLDGHRRLEAAKELLLDKVCGGCGERQLVVGVECAGFEP